MTDVQVDALTVGFVWSKLDAIADEMGETLRRTAYSDAVREGRDFSAALFDRRGRLLAQADLSPGHLGAVPDAVRNMLRPFRRDSLRPGDVITMNDAYLGSGHLPDFYSLSPVFHQGEICGYVVVSAHLVDVGGTRPGSQSVEGVVDMFQEGPRIPPVMLYRAGVPNDDLFSVIGGRAASCRCSVPAAAARAPCSIWWRVSKRLLRGRSWSGARVSPGQGRTGAWSSSPTTRSSTGTPYGRTSNSP